MQFNFTGASSTGKTTTLNMLHTHLPDYEIKTNIIRDLVSKENISLNEAGTRRGQELIFTAYFDSLILNKDKNYISDRWTEAEYAQCSEDLGISIRRVKEYANIIFKTNISYYDSFTNNNMNSDDCDADGWVLNSCNAKQIIKI